VREVVDVPFDPDARGTPEAVAALARIQARLWDLIRGEARDAEREMLVHDA
jgi:hypothetical protein